MRNRLIVALEWFWAYLTYRPSTRLITDEIPIPTRGALAPSTEEIDVAADLSMAEHDKPVVGSLMHL